jgi:transposase
MKFAPLFAAALFAAPLAAFAQVEHSQATIIAPAYVPAYPSSYAPDCAVREDDLARRKSVLDDERVSNDYERDRLDSEAVSLTNELRGLDTSSTAAVAAYNARSDDHNRRVNEHNQRVADMNSRVAQVTDQVVATNRYCGY